jgi:hypothetical protein
LPLLAIGAIFYFKRFIKDPVGMTQFPAGAKCLLESLPLQHCDATFTYPPFFALSMIPFAPLSMPVRNIIWYCITLAAITLCFMCCDFLARKTTSEAWSERELVWLRGLTFLLSLKFVLAVLENQSYDAVVVLFVCAGLVALVQRRDVLGGASLGIAVALKITPLLFLPYLVFKRRYVAAAAMAVVLTVASFLPDLLFAPVGSPYGYVAAWVREVGGPAMTERLEGPLHVFWFAGNPNNSSLRGLAGMFVVDHNNAVFFRPLLFTIYAVYIAIVAVMLWRTRERQDTVPVDGALLALSMLMLSPMTSHSHCIALLLPYAVLLAVWIKDRQTRLLGGAVLALSFLLASLSAGDIVGRAASVLSGEYRLPIFGMLILLVYFAAAIRMPREVPQNARKAAV